MQEFQLIYVDQEGRLYYGFKVLGVFKFVECRVYKGFCFFFFDIDDCSFVYLWKGDMWQFVCIICI